MQHIIDGAQRFSDEVYPTMTELFGKLAKGQWPKVLFITCSDSRIDPNLITQTLPGDLFVIRNAGNLAPTADADPAGAAAVEYAVAALKVEHIVVCGHLGCGAMTGLLNPDALETLPVVKDWVENAVVTREACKDIPEDERLPAAIKHNAIEQLSCLRQHPSVATALANGQLDLHAWVYDIAGGKVESVATVSS